MQPVIGRAETQEMLRIIEKLRRDVELSEKKLTAPLLPLSLEVKGGKRTDPLYLTTPRERAELLGNLGVDAVIAHTLAPSFMAGRSL